MKHLFKKFKIKAILPLINEIKRIINRAIGLTQTLELSHIVACKFRCSSRIEFIRTIDYGYELESLCCFIYMLKSNDVVWDVGASIGLYSIHSAYVAESVYAFEPDPDTYKRLNENIKLNNLERKVSGLSLGLGKRTGVIQLSTDGLEGKAPAFNAKSRHCGLISVNVSTIDDILISRNLEPPSVVKIDIEGAEYDLLKGGEKLFNGKKRPRLLFIEGHPQYLPDFGASIEDLLEIIKNYGYKIILNKKRLDQVHIMAVYYN
jgi:FkbM family methyltransferase